MLHCSVSTAGVSYCHTQIHHTVHTQFASVPLIIYLQHEWETGTRRTTDGCKYASAVVAWPGRGVGGVQKQWPSLSDSVLAERLNTDRGDKSSGQVATLAQKVNVQFASPSGHKRAIDSRPESRQMPAILTQRDYCRSQRCHLSEQRDAHPPSSSVLLRHEEILCFL